MTIAGNTEQKILMRGSYGKELTIALVSAQANGDPPRMKLISAKTDDGQSVSFDQMSAAWVIEETAEMLAPINSKL